MPQPISFGNDFFGSEFMTAFCTFSLSHMFSKVFSCVDHFCFRSALRTLHLSSHPSAIFADYLFCFWVTMCYVFGSKEPNRCYLPQRPPFFFFAIGVTSYFIFTAYNCSSLFSQCVLSISVIRSKYNLRSNELSVERKITNSREHSS